MSKRALTEGTGFLLAALRESSSAQGTSESDAPSFKQNRLDEQASCSVDNEPIESIQPIKNEESESVVSYRLQRPELPSQTELSFDKFRLKQEHVKEYSDSKCKNNFLKQIAFNYDGELIFSTAQDRHLRIYQALQGDDPIYQLDHEIMHGDLIYDACFLANTQELNLIASTSRCAPIHVWCADDGKTLSTYRGINHLDELSSAYSICSGHATNHNLIAGYKKVIRIFDLKRYGRQMYEIATVQKHGMSQPGIISTVAQCPTNPDVILAGSYSGTVGIYSLSTFMKGLQTVHQAHLPKNNGVTQVLYDTTNEHRYYVGSRLQSTISIFDTRMNIGAITSLYRPCVTNQRVSFTQTRDGKFLISGTTTGDIYVWNIAEAIDSRPLAQMDAIKPTFVHSGAVCTVGAVAMHPVRALLATGSGQRTFPHPVIDLEDEVPNSDRPYTCRTEFDNAMRLWSL